MKLRHLCACALLASAPLACADPLSQASSLDAVPDARVAMAALQTSKEITPNCVATPLSTTPVGPSWQFELNTAGASAPPAVFRGTFWRRPCAAAGDAQLLLTLTPLSGIPFVCGGLRVVLVQNLQQTNELSFDPDPNNGVVDSFCGSLLVPTTVVLNEYSAAFDFNDDAQFTFVYLSGISSSPNASVTVGTYNPADYGLPPSPLPLSGKLSGSYYDPARDGEGVVIEIGQVGTRRVFFLTWYTYAGGAQRWIVGNTDFPAGASEITVPLIMTSGGYFGSAFDPAQVIRMNWGSATVSFPTCTSMRFQWVELGGQIGSYQYRRLVDSLEGIACP